ncbi:17278_t:CDS:2 [Cetraspora pellucida]|uniref:17278_t:CDS:1 n=1 Tax=Cetraspora pellucida TaxID=1433469 RepID=A0A9N9CKE8_9GLOM|nr:17278_t:CDS:2 [Cetraspora pellucida]
MNETLIETGQEDYNKPINSPNLLFLISKRGDPNYPILQR